MHCGRRCPCSLGIFFGLCVRHLAGTGGLYLGVSARHQPHRLCRVYAVRTRKPAVLRRIAFGRSHHDHRYQQPAHVLWPELSFPLPCDGRAHGAAFARRLYGNRLFHDGAVCRVVHRAIQRLLGLFCALGCLFVFGASHFIVPALRLWRCNTLLSICVGTAVYMLLLRLF